MACRRSSRLRGVVARETPLQRAACNLQAPWNTIEQHMLVAWRRRPGHERKGAVVIYISLSVSIYHAEVVYSLRVSPYRKRRMTSWTSRAIFREFQSLSNQYTDKPLYPLPAEPRALRRGIPYHVFLKSRKQHSRNQIRHFSNTILLARIQCNPGSHTASVYRKGKRQSFNSSVDCIVFGG